MENKLTEDFLVGVNEIIKSEDDKDQLFLSLRNYRNSLDLDTLMKGLRSVVTTPGRIPLYDAIRPLIPLNHQLAYDRRTLWASTQRRLRVIRLPRRDLPPNTKLGFALRGGLEHGVGFFVSQVAPDSIAAQGGLREGDQIVRINGFLVEHATHNEVMALIRSRPELLMKVRRVGMLPKKEHFDDTVSWAPSTYGIESESDRMSNPSDDLVNFGSDADEMRLFVNTRGAQTLGCTIFSGPPSKPGIFIQSVVPGGLTHEAGLREGDQILVVNGISFTNISHSSAIMTMKGSTNLMMTIRRQAGLSLLRYSTNSNMDTTDSLEMRKVAQLKELTTRRDDIKMTVNRHSDDGLTVDSSSDTLTPSVDDRILAHPPPSSNSNVFFRRPDEPRDLPSHSVESPLIMRGIDMAGDSPSPQPSPSSTVLSDLHFSKEESGGREVESVRLTARPPVWESSGVELEEVPGGRVVIAQVDYGSPAFQADVRKGDYLLAIGHEKLSGKRLDYISGLLKRAESQPEYILSLARAPSGIFDDEVTYF